MLDDVTVLLLGPVEIHGPAGPADLRGAGHRTLVARLAARPGQPVPAQALIEALWDDDNPATALKTMHSHLARLRKDLRAGGFDGLITTRESGYVLNVRPELVDAVRFESLAHRGQSELDAADPAAAVRTLGAADRLWRGEPMTGCRRGRWIRQEADRLVEAHLAATENLIGARLLTGGHADAVGALSPLVEQHPFRERLWELLMTALWHAGRQGEALAAYQRARSVLADQLGIEPGPRLRELESSILRGEAALTPAAAASARIGNLPADVTSFVRRDGDTAAVSWLLATSRMVSLTGVGGVGKSRLALHVARVNQQVYLDGAWLVELAALTDPALLAHTVAEALDVHDQSGRDMTAVLVEQLRSRDLMLVLDNCEHLADACAALVGTLLRAAPRVRVLTTSRQPLRADGERVFLVSPLPVPEPDVDDGVDCPSVALFVERAGAAAPGFQLTAANRDTVLALCRQLEGIPLALELAALRLRILSPAQLLSRLADRFRLLTSGRSTALARQQTLRATVDWSFELCLPVERVLWRRVAVFAGGFDLEAAEHVCSDDDLPADAVLDVLAGLVDKSVVVRVQGDGAARYRLLETLRQYGHERLRAAGEEREFRRRHRDWYLGVAERGERDWFGPAQPDVSSNVGQDHANMRAALEFCMTTPDQAGTGLRMAGTLWFYWIGCGLLAEGRHWLDWALDQVPPTATARPRALWIAGYVATLQGDTAHARHLLGQVGPDADEPAQAHATFVRGAAAVFQGDLAAGARLLADAHTRHHRLGQLDSNVIMTRVALAITVAFQGDLAGAEALCAEAQAVCEANGEQWALAYAHWVLAFTAAGQGRLHRATELARESLRIKYVFHDLLGMAVAIELLALLAVSTGAPERAAVLLGCAHRIWPRVGAQLFGSDHFNATHRQCEALTRQALGALGYEVAFDQGTRLSLAETTAYALDDKADVR
ncbi:hypothetical protein GCM10029964_107220 [Kibdelosporangium lantanae]